MSVIANFTYEQKYKKSSHCITLDPARIKLINKNPTKNILR